MNRTKAYSLLACAAALVLMTSGMTANAQTTGSKTGAKTAKAEAAKVYECSHCKAQYTAAEAKAHGMKCCGRKLVKIAASKPAKSKQKS